MKKFIYFKNLATCLLIAWLLSRGGAVFAQVYFNTQLHFEIEVGCIDYTEFSIKLTECETNTQFYLYPNPTTHTCNVVYRFYEKGAYTIVLRDMSGKELQNYPLSNLNGTLPIDLSPLQRGTYIIECRKDDILTNVLKLIKH